MNESSSNHSAGNLRAGGYLPFLLLLFVGSGCAALIYEIVWLQMLQLVVGLTTVSLGVLLGTFMGGMCLGSLLLSRLISARRNPLRVYALLELGIGIMGIVVLFGMPWIDRIYTSAGGRGFAGILFRAVVAGVCLLPPTLLMGDAAGDFALGRDDSARSFVAGILLRRKHRRRGVRLFAGGVLFAASA